MEFRVMMRGMKSRDRQAVICLESERHRLNREGHVTTVIKAITADSQPISSSPRSVQSGSTPQRTPGRPAGASSARQPDEEDEEEPSGSAQDPPSGRLAEGGGGGVPSP